MEDMRSPIDSISSSAWQLGNLSIMEVDVAELFSPGRFAEASSAFQLTAGSAFDLRLNWDLSLEADRQEVWRRLHIELPLLVVGSPPCASVSTLQALSKDSDAKRRALKAGIRHISFCCAVYAWQHQRGAGFLHEHPWGAWSFKLDCVQSVRRLPDVSLFRCDQCMFGQVAWHRGPNGWEQLPARKRTGW